MRAFLVPRLRSFLLPGQDDDFRVAVEGARWREVVRELDEELRAWTKYGSTPRQVQKSGSAVGVRDLLHEIIKDRGLVLHE